MKRIWGVRIVSIAIVVVLFAVLLSGCASTDLLPESGEAAAGMRLVVTRKPMREEKALQRFLILCVKLSYR